MAAPSSDRAGIRQIIRALKAASLPVVEVFDGEETIKVRTETEAIDAIMAVDDATLFVHDHESNRNPWVRFVMGNEPEEVACDWSLGVERFERVLDEVTDGWWF